MSKETKAQAMLSPGQQQFIDDLASLLLPWGMTSAVSRLYGFLLLQGEPVSLDQISESLDISKSTASVSARQLEQSKLARRHSERGSKRASYSAVDGNIGVLAEHIAKLGELSALFQSTIDHANDDAAAERLQNNAAYCAYMQKVMRNAMRELESEGVLSLPVKRVKARA